MWDARSDLAAGVVALQRPVAALVADQYGFLKLVAVSDPSQDEQPCRDQFMPEVTAGSCQPETGEDASLYQTGRPRGRPRRPFVPKSSGCRAGS